MDRRPPARHSELHVRGTSRAAVLEYLAFTAKHGVDEPWRVVANVKITVTVPSTGTT